MIKDLNLVIIWLEVQFLAYAYGKNHIKRKNSSCVSHKFSDRDSSQLNDGENFVTNHISKINYEVKTNHLKSNNISKSILHL